ncbi:DUF2057 family protein [Vibrio viridaestus]|uniref:DUF2057 domain-containing protein n=1 Tax=Vibrio viridaestus TaxID=2487322 RepID=A0A3N9TIG9_9VIBR|nr:DUF2057 family protein [Vibrio viridaestus]RQW63890.1 DUF2057 domain-containing protein [Vibrio viridaestus]
MRNSIIFIIGFLLTLNANASMLEVSSNVDVLAINGKAVKEKRQYELENTKNQLVVQYVEALRNGSTTKKYQSKPYVLEVSSVNGDMKLSHKSYLNYSAADAAFRNNINGWTFQNKNGDSIELNMSVLPNVSSIMPYQDIESTVKQYNTNNQISELNNDAQSVEYTNISMKDVKVWFLNSSQQDRKAILKWMIEQ